MYDGSLFLPVLFEHIPKNDISIEQMLNDRRLYPYVASSFTSLSKRSAGTLLSCIRELRSIKVIRPDLIIAPPDDALADLLEPINKEKKAKNPTKQTLLIPSRIYSAIITGFSEELDEYLKVSSEFESLYSHLSEVFKKAKNTNAITDMKKNLESNGFSEWDNLLKKHGVYDYCKKYTLEHKKQISKQLKNIQDISRYWVHLFTGMRNEEVSYLSYGCLASVNTNGAYVKIVRGYTSKTVGTGQTPTFWITSDIIDKAIYSAQSIARIIANECELTVSDSKYPLLPAFSHHSGKHSKDGELAIYDTKISDSPERKRLEATFSSSNYLRESLIVTEDDLRELQIFDGFSDLESIKVGEFWPLETHQARRSLAVYLARSGMVSIGAMQAQYKHLHTAMTSYYRNNSTFATNFILNNEDDEYHRHQMSFINDIEQEQRVRILVNLNTHSVSFEHSGTLTHCQV